jgi:hypothetical protein
MYKHPHFNLYIHDDQELATHLGGEILERETLHEWPLSYVERVATVQGQWIYKSQFGPTVEAEFYAVARSDLLGQVRTIYQADGHACTLRDYIDAPLIEDLDLTEMQAALMVRQVRSQMNAIEGDLPYLYDIRTPDQWLALAERTLQDIVALIGQKRYTATTSEMVQTLQRWARSDSTIEAVRSHPGHVHGDLHGDNVFVLPDGSYRVIDWQRPFRGPTELDVASMIESLGFNPLNHVSPGIVQIRDFVLIHWITVCAVRWYPEATQGYDRLTAEQVLEIQSLS